jgi:hypothetical protein
VHELSKLYAEQVDNIVFIIWQFNPGHGMLPIPHAKETLEICLNNGIINFAEARETSILASRHHVPQGSTVRRTPPLAA